MPLPKELPRSRQAVSGAPAAPSAVEKGRHVGGGEGKTAARVLANRYCVGQKLGSGSFGCAYLVFDLKANNEK